MRKILDLKKLLKSTKIHAIMLNLEEELPKQFFAALSL